MSRLLKIDNFTVSDDSDCYVIAEIGHNHQGSLEKCKELFQSAKNCGANAVKLQKRSNRTLYTNTMFNERYNSENSYGATYGEHREFLEFGLDEYRELQSYAKELGITFFATAFDLSSADFLADLNMPAYKIASGDIKSTPLLEHVAKIGKPMFVSTGGATMGDVQRAYDTIMPINSQLCIMQCTASYPCAFETLNLNVITSFRNAFPDIVIGLSGHDNGYTMGLVGYMLGARVIEKHFTINRALKGTDQAFSLEASGMRRLVRDLRRTPLALGDGVKRVYKDEEAPIRKMGKSLVATTDLPTGHTLTTSDIALRSPAGGTPPYEFDHYIGRKTGKRLATDDTIDETSVT